jgi:hypothetical protein
MIDTDRNHIGAGPGLNSFTNKPIPEILLKISEYFTN